MTKLTKKHIYYLKFGTYGLIGGIILTGLSLLLAQLWQPLILPYALLILPVIIIGANFSILAGGILQTGMGYETFGSPFWISLLGIYFILLGVLVGYIKQRKK